MKRGSTPGHRPPPPTSTDKYHRGSRKSPNIHVVERRPTKTTSELTTKPVFSCHFWQSCAEKIQSVLRSRGQDLHTADTNLELWCKGKKSKHSHAAGYSVFLKDLWRGIVYHFSERMKGAAREGGERGGRRGVAKTQWGRVYSKTGRGTPHICGRAAAFCFAPRSLLQPPSPYVILPLRPGWHFAI